MRSAQVNHPGLVRLCVLREGASWWAGPLHGTCRLLALLALAATLLSCARASPATTVETHQGIGLTATRSPGVIASATWARSPSPAPRLSPAKPSPTPVPTLRSPATATAAVEASVPVHSYRTVAVYPHDPAAFTQGLVYAQGVLYESTGRYGATTLRKVDLESSEVLQIRTLPDLYFGEGLTLFDDRLYQLTWREQVGFVYDQETFRLLRTFSYATEGWGLCHDGQRLIMSDGTSTLRFLDPDTQVETGSIEVVLDGHPVSRLNELEYVQGEVFANVWQTDTVVRIDPETGQVTGIIDLRGLLLPEDRLLPVDVLNGIAYDKERDRLFVTGKLWPKLFEIELVPAGLVMTPQP